MRFARGLAWAAVVIACAVAFVETGHVALLGAGVAALVVPLAGWACAFVASRRVRASLAVSGSVRKGEAAGVVLALDNVSALPVVFAEVEVEARNLLTGEEAVLSTGASIGPRCRAEVELEALCERSGRMECRVRAVRLFDPLRVLSCTARSDAQARFTVVPDMREVRLGDVHSASPLSDTTVFSPFVRGADLTETFGLRDYEPGDELRRVHWKLSEKTGQLVVREASLPLDNSILLFWDKTLPVGFGADGVPAAADAMAEVVLACMMDLVRAGVSFEVASNVVETGRCPRFFVTDEAEAFEVVGHLLSQPLGVADERGLAVYERYYGGFSCSRIIDVCAGPFGALAALSGERGVLAFSCAGGAAQGARAGVRRFGAVTEIGFAPGAVAEALQMAEAV